MFDADETPQPALSPETLDRLQVLLADRGPGAAVDALCEELKANGDWGALFYAMLMKKRVELGVSPFPTGSSSEMPANTHAPYEDAIREAGRFVGNEYLKKNDLRKAWFYFNMLGEPAAVREHIEWLVPGEDEDVQPIIEVALYNGVHPAKGFDLLLKRYGICNAITTYSGQDFSRNPAAKQECIRALVRSLSEQLLERLKSDLEGRNVPVPANATIGEIVRTHPELFDDGAYHIDTSHLSSVVQFSLELEACPERALARELCAYGERLNDNFKFASDPPFENSYADYRMLLEVLDGIEVEKGLAHFKSKIEREFEEGNTFPAEVYVNLLLKVGRREEALSVAKAYLVKQGRPLSCPGVYDLCQQAKDFDGLADAARERGDSVTYLAGLIAAKQGS